MNMLKHIHVETKNDAKQTISTLAGDDKDKDASDTNKSKETKTKDKKDKKEKTDHKAKEERDKKKVKNKEGGLEVQSVGAVQDGRSPAKDTLIFAHDLDTVSKFRLFMKEKVIFSYSIVVA